MTVLFGRDRPNNNIDKVLLTCITLIWEHNNSAHVSCFFILAAIDSATTTQRLCRWVIMYLHPALPPLREGNTISYLSDVPSRVSHKSLSMILSSTPEWVWGMDLLPKSVLQQYTSIIQWIWFSYPLKICDFQQLFLFAPFG